MANNNDTNVLLDSLLRVASDQWNVNIDDINELMSKVSFHESKNVVDAIQGGDIKKRGRGLYQYETGSGQGANTAINRLKSLLGYTPSFIEGLEDINYDISGLNKNEQSILFLADKLKNPAKASNLGLIKGKGDLSDDEIANFWVDYHWAGHKGDMEKRNLQKDKFILDLNEGYRKNLLNK